MMDEAARLFGSGAEGREFRVVRKRGEPLLLLPRRADAARTCLQLYPAQTDRARLARRLLDWALRVPGLPWPPRIRLPWNADAPLPKFLQQRSGGGELEFGALLGNPRAEGRRWTLLLFKEGAPRHVVKVGHTARARELIAAEAAVLAALPPGLPGRPRGETQLAADEVGALAMDYVPGTPPSIEGSEGEIAALLGGWLDAGRLLPLSEIPFWQEICKLLPEAATSLAERIGTAPLRPAIFHGDFAPWNIRATGDRWTAIDWERGELCGLPGWDWFHFLTQTQILVRRRNASEVLAQTETLFATAAWRAYAERAQIAGRERLLLAAYLLWLDEIIPPTEGRATLQALRRLLSAKLETRNPKLGT